MSCRNTSVCGQISARILCTQCSVLLFVGDSCRLGRSLILKFTSRTPHHPHWGKRVLFPEEWWDMIPSISNYDLIRTPSLLPVVSTGPPFARTPLYGNPCLWVSPKGLKKPHIFSPSPKFPAHQISIFCHSPLCLTETHKVPFGDAQRFIVQLMYQHPR